MKIHLLTTIGVALSIACTALVTTSPAQASVAAWNGSGANDSINWGQVGPDKTTVVSGSTVSSTTGINATVSDGAPNMTRLQEGSSWFGNFTVGDPVLYSGDPNNPFAAANSITIDFSTAVQAAGAQISSNFYGDYMARILTNDGSFFDVSGTMNGNEDNTAPFLGVISTSADITSIEFSLLSNQGAGFGINNVSLIHGAAGVPESSTWAMMLLGFGAVGFGVRRAKKRRQIPQHA